MQESTGTAWEAVENLFASAFGLPSKGELGKPTAG